MATPAYHPASLSAVTETDKSEGSPVVCQGSHCNRKETTKAGKTVPWIKREPWKREELGSGSQDPGERPNVTLPRLPFQYCGVDTGGLLKLDGQPVWRLRFSKRPCLKKLSGYWQDGS